MILPLIFLIFVIALVTFLALRVKTKQKFLQYVPPTFGDLDEFKKNLTQQLSSLSLGIKSPTTQQTQEPPPELLTTERSYVQQLTQLVNQFEIPLVKQEILTPNKAKELFGNADDLLQFHLTFHKQLEDAFSKGERISKVFLKLAPFLKLYSEYSKNYWKALAVLDSQTQRTPALIQFIESQKAPDPKHGSGKQYFDSLLIAPVQRLMRYHLLLERMREMSTDKTEQAEFAEAVAIVKKIADFVNERQRDYENQFKVHKFEKKRLHKPTWCAFCRSFMFGLSASTCVECGLSFHESCSKSIKSLKNCRSAPPSNLSDIPSPPSRANSLSPPALDSNSRPNSSNSNVLNNSSNSNNSPASPALKNSANSTNSTPSPTPASPSLNTSGGRQMAPPSLNNAGYRATVALPPQHRTEPQLPASALSNSSNSNKKKD